MNWLPTKLVFAGILSLGALPLFGNDVTATAGSCKSVTPRAKVHFKIVRQHSLGDKGLELFVSVAPDSVNESNLLTIGCGLGVAKHREPFLMVWFFNDPRAAKLWRLGAVEKLVSDRSLRGSYSFNRDNGTHTLIWYPNQEDHSKFVTINLGSPPPD